MVSLLFSCIQTHMLLYGKCLVNRTINSKSVCGQGNKSGLFATVGGLAQYEGSFSPV